VLSNKSSYQFSTFIKYIATKTIEILFMKTLSRAHPLWLAYLLHRLSGLFLALFLPLHFYVLAKAISAPETLDGFLLLTQSPAVKHDKAV